MFRRILDFFWSPCPSGLPHRTRWGVVTNWLGKKYCWHSECMRANFRECGVSTDAPRNCRHCGADLTDTQGHFCEGFPRDTGRK